MDNQTYYYNNINCGELFFHEYLYIYTLTQTLTIFLRKA